MNIYQDILSAKIAGKKLLAVLIDPEKINLENIPSFLNKVHQSIATHIFVGGSTDKNHQTENVVIAIKKATHLPVVLFPGDVAQITQKADGILFLSLLSGRNPEYLIEQQIKAAPFLKNTDLEILPTGYILIDGQKETATQRVSSTKPIAQTSIELIINTALAGEFSGKKLIYLEAGSGAKVPVDENTISIVKNNISIPLIIGGGIRSKQQIENTFNAGADMIVIGTAFENNESFFEDLKSSKFTQYN
ncbi:geranylgeranylglyceryl/heptaprenylglyceryl phosphate synthase [Polaribacter sargassicola]|uniref:geranylgeranylglyceryl/heptaprenylglyceryl phosphate synthase n=1 Tax=Polaribacter sargassicola TaxID=2836891 RepID=UPI0034D2641B